MLPALVPGPEVAEDMVVVAVVVSMAGGAEASTVATAGGAFSVATGEAASAVVTEVIGVVTVAGDMDAAGDMGMASG